MLKKFFSILLAVAFCLTSTVAFADDKGAKREKKEEVVSTEKRKEKAKEEAQNSEEDEDVQDEDAGDKDEKEKDTEVRKGKGKSKVVKEELEAKKKERKEARLEAADFIKDLHRMFKDADRETKKEILAEISKIKKELKNHSIGVFVRGLVVDFKKYDNVEPVIEKDRVLIPLRAIAETLGADVLWSGETGSIAITKGDVSIVLNIGSNTALVNGKEVTLEVAPKIIRDRALVPMRFISETLNLGVEWDEDSQTVIVDYKEEDDINTDEGDATEDTIEDTDEDTTENTDEENSIQE